MNFKHVLSLCLSSLVMVSIMCSDDDDKSSNGGDHNGLKMNAVALVSDTAKDSARVDSNLVNAWGIAVSPTNNFWVNSNGKGLTLVLDQNGASVTTPITVPTPTATTGGNPTGIIANTSFIIPGTSDTSKFILVTEDGIIAAYSTGAAAVKVADRSSAGAVYKGLTYFTSAGKKYLAAADFKLGTVDVFDSTFTFVTDTMFKDTAIPAGFAPFNVRTINGKIYVLYAKQKGPDNTDDTAGAGNGYINVFDTNGVRVKRLVSQGLLNSPWGITLSTSGFPGFANALLVGNFGDGTINAYDTNGTALGTVVDTTSNPLVIDGLWDLTFASGTGNTLFFSAGPDDESHGLFGKIVSSGK